MAVMTAERPLREKLGDEGTNSLVKLFDKFEENIKVDVIALSADKYERRLSEEIANIRIDMGLHKSELKGDMTELRAELKEDMAGLKAELKQDMAELKSELKQDMAELKSELKGDMTGLRAELKGDIAGLRAELKESEERYERRLSEETGKIRVEMAGLRAELKEDIAGVRTELSGKISSSYASLIKWMFIFWLGQIGAILGILFAFFKS